MARFPEAVFVCLQRNRAEVIDSYMNWTSPSINRWSNHEGKQWKKSPWDVAFPKFDEQDKAKASRTLT